MASNNNVGVAVDKMASVLAARLKAHRLTTRIIGVSYPADSVSVLWPSNAQIALLPINAAAALALYADHNVKAYLAGLNQGVASSVSELTTEAAKCHSASFVLAGYSQGAMVVHQAELRLQAAGKTSILKRIVGTLLLGDGDRTARTAAKEFGTSSVGAEDIRTYLPNQNSRQDVEDPALTANICNAGDIVCDFNLERIPHAKAATGVHTSYARLSHGHYVYDPALTAASTWMANRIIAGRPGVAGGTRLLLEAPVQANYLPRPGLRVVDGGISTWCQAGYIAGNSYRCFAGNSIYDSCWTDNSDPATTAVICQGAPWDTRVVRLTVPYQGGPPDIGATGGGLSPFDSSPSPIGPGLPWAVQLTTGEKCLVLSHFQTHIGKHFVAYTCVTRTGRPDLRVLLDYPRHSRPDWTIGTATHNASWTHFKIGLRASIQTAWYGTPDRASEQAAASSTCSASGLAYAAQAYEFANGNPDGYLSVMTSHACDAGYAIINFDQSVPPSGGPEYQAEIAFQATPSGWAFVGAASYIAPGDFGMPVDAVTQIQAQLAADPFIENVTFD